MRTMSKIVAAFFVMAVALVGIVSNPGIVNALTKEFGDPTYFKTTATFLGASPLVFEGATDNAYETTFAITDPASSDKTITFPNATGTVITTGNLSDVSGTMTAVTVSGATALNGTVGLGDAAADVVTITGTIAGGTPLVFEGATANDFETSFVITDPTTPDKTITFPDATGTVVTTGNLTAITSTGTLSAVTVSGATALNGTVGLGDAEADAITVTGSLSDFNFQTGLAGGADIACVAAVADTAGQSIDVTGQAGGAASAGQVGRAGGVVTLTGGAGSAKEGVGANDGDGGDVVLTGGAKGGSTGGSEVDGVVRVGSPTINGVKATNMLAVAGPLEVDGAVVLGTQTVTTSLQNPGRYTFTICGDETTVNNNTVYYGPDLTLAATFDGLTCDIAAVGNTTEATVDEPLFAGKDVHVVGMVCRNAADANADVSYTLRNAAGATTPSVTCTIADNGRDCVADVQTTTVLAAGSTFAVAVASTGDLGAVGFVCQITVAF